MNFLTKRLLHIIVIISILYFIKHIFPKSCYSFKQLSFLPQVQILKKIYAGNFFSAGVDTSTPAQYIFHVYLVVNPKRAMEFKMAVTVGLQDISSMYITLENPNAYTLHIFIIKNYVDWICLCSP